MRIELFAFVPETAFVSDLREVATKEDRAEGWVADVAQRLHEESPSLAAASCTAIDGDIGR